MVKLDAATARALEKVAKASGKSTTQLTRAALREFLEDYWDMKCSAGPSAVRSLCHGLR